MDLIRMQNANGSWNGPLPFATSSKVPDELAAIPNVWFTLLVVAKFNKDFTDKKTQWQQIVIKAIKWIKSQLATASLTDQYDSLKSKSESTV
ncbi:hypothetical protein PPL_00595 [Heterostelium album PN500]|uniref:Uncharacterized protein n=1 Tax=Heterostelium pallidum (strain ATCC 26659 / Pp 5 / PN500) TaxID=670386 RepID=D3AWW7_HETP5|nr:hypothetical protein PPL_00595 [Heterostelium album PN500]EFA86790.1 hypothetical protein PPL_00595 [Heterostelium album PN500]|eukprot:XP_020438894.1 hypothetical protein PPL_00595 [Heterostelium album PN500]